MDAQTWELFCPALHFAIYVFGCVWLQWYISQHKTIIWTKQHRYEYLRSDTVLKIIDEARTFSLDLWINFVGITLHNMCPLHQMPNSISPPPIQTWINITPPPIHPSFEPSFHLKPREGFNDLMKRLIGFLFNAFLWLENCHLECSFMLALLVSAASKWNPKWGLSAAELNGAPAELKDQS